MRIMSKRILVVEDNALMLEVLVYILASNGYEVYTLSNGVEVFNNIKKIHPDLVIIDLVLPGIAGTEICQLIKLNATTQHLPVIMCSGDDIQAEIFNRRGAPDDVLQKPFDINSLIKKVAYQLAA
jgi:DNA-binding response OmpR family regulator